MVDFARLLNRTPEEREADRRDMEEAFNARASAEDAAERQRLIRETVVISLVEAPHVSVTPSGDRIVTFYGDRNGERVVARWKVPVDGRPAEQEALRYPEGALLTLLGRFERVSWNRAGDRQSRLEFLTAHHSLAQVKRVPQPAER